MTPRAALARACALWLGLHASPALAERIQLGTPIRVDGVAAYVGGTSPGEGVRVLLRSDVELRARLSLLAAGDPEAATALLPAELLRATLNELLGESLISIEAIRLGLSDPSAREVQEQRRRLLGMGRSEAEFEQLLEALEVSNEEVEQIARQRAVVGAFLAVNLEGTIDVSESELVRAYETEDHPFQGLPYAEEKPRFVAWLNQKRLQEAVGRWILSLKERIPHRVIAKF